MALSSDDTFYGSVGGAPPDYDQALESPSLDAGEKARREEQWKAELVLLEDEIGTLKSVLSAKVNEAVELKRKLGITPIVELKEDLKHGLQAIKESGTVQKTNEKLHQIGESIAASDAYQKTNTALKSFGAFASKKMGDLRSSTAFKSVEGKVGGAYSSIKRQVSGSQSEENFEDALSGNNEKEEEPKLTDLSLS